MKYKKYENYETYSARIRTEIFLSKEILENKIQGKVKFFAYPYGAYSSTIKDLAIQTGYEGIFNARASRVETGRQTMIGGALCSDFADAGTDYTPSSSSITKLCHTNNDHIGTAFQVWKLGPNKEWLGDAGWLGEQKIEQGEKKCFGVTYGNWYHWDVWYCDQTQCVCDSYSGEGCGSSYGCTGDKNLKVTRSCTPSGCAEEEVCTWYSDMASIDDKASCIGVCEDSDGSLYAFKTKVTATEGSESDTDFCIPGTDELFEAGCDGSGLTSRLKDCKDYGSDWMCKDGTCIIESTCGTDRRECVTSSSYKVCASDSWGATLQCPSNIPNCEDGICVALPGQPKIVETKSAVATSLNGKIRVTFYLKNDGAPLTGEIKAMMEIQPKSLGHAGAIGGTQDVCDTGSPQNVHKAFGLGGGDSGTLTLETSPPVTGDYFIRYYLYDKCAKDGGTSKGLSGTLEGPYSVTVDTQVECGDGICAGWPYETFESCKAIKSNGEPECGSWCGDQVCDPAKDTNSNCPEDCKCEADGICGSEWGCTADNDPDCEEEDPELCSSQTTKEICEGADCVWSLEWWKPGNEYECKDMPEKECCQKQEFGEDVKYKWGTPYCYNVLPKTTWIKTTKSKCEDEIGPEPTPTDCAKQNTQASCEDEDCYWDGEECKATAPVKPGEECRDHETKKACNDEECYWAVTDDDEGCIPACKTGTLLDSELRDPLFTPTEKEMKQASCERSIDCCPIEGYEVGCVREDKFEDVYGISLTKGFWARFADWFDADNGVCVAREEGDVGICRFFDFLEPIGGEKYSCTIGIVGGVLVLLLFLKILIGKN